MLTKTLFQSGLFCPKRLWYEVHEPGAPELVPDAQTQWMFRQGQEVTVAAQSRVPGARYEATLQAADLHARVDILETLDDGSHALIEVKGSNEIKIEHKWDVAFQRYVAEVAGLKVARCELMHLNRECRHPDLAPLFLRRDVSNDIAPLVAAVPALAAQFLAVLEGPLPGDSRNAHCGDCPFYSRCWPQGRFGVNRFHRMKWGEKLALEHAGADTFTKVPQGTKLTPIQKRQQESAYTEGLVVESSMGAALAEWKRPLVYLDFETVAFAIPRFPGTTPWTKIPVQYSAHLEEEAGYRHVHFLAHDGADPRPAIAESLVAECVGEGAVVAYHASFEQGRLRELAEAVPGMRDALMRIHDRVVDLQPIVERHVYHPDFAGSFSLKVVLPTLCPDVTYEDLVIGDGSTAQLELARLLYGSAPMSKDERDALRGALLAYCERDTWAMVALHRKLLGLAES
jgi:CRISPR/Cas system-associated exonuclease Cas4 (RecB family)